MQAEGLILAGGGSTRMGGLHKGSLLYRKKTFIQILEDELKKEATHVSISYGAKRREYAGECSVIMDYYPGCGPIGGIHAGLRECRGEFLLTAACDMPLLKIELYRYLYDTLLGKEKIGISYDGAVPIVDGRIHPLSAIYRRRAGSRMEEQILAGNYRLTDALKCMNILYADVTEQKGYVQMLRNINTLKEYERLIKYE